MAEVAEKTNVTALRKAEAPPPPEAASPVEQSPLRDGRRRTVRWALLAAGPLAVAAGVGWFWLTGGRYVGTDNAYVHADTVSVATDVPGLVRSVEVRDEALAGLGGAERERLLAALELVKANLQASLGAAVNEDDDAERKHG